MRSSDTSGRWILSIIRFRALYLFGSLGRLRSHPALGRCSLVDLFPVRTRAFADKCGLLITSSCWLSHVTCNKTGEKLTLAGDTNAKRIVSRYAMVLMGIEMMQVRDSERICCSSCIRTSAAGTGSALQKGRQFRKLNIYP